MPQILEGLWLGRRTGSRRSSHPNRWFSLNSGLGIILICPDAHWQMFGILIRFESCRLSKHMDCVFFGWCPMAHGFWRIIYLKLSMSPSDLVWRYPKLVEKKVTRCDNSDVKAVMVDDTKVLREETHATFSTDTTFPVVLTIAPETKKHANACSPWHAPYRYSRNHTNFQE